MEHWLTYVKHSYQVILDAEAKLCINLEHQTEAYMVHLFARYMDKPNINKDPICIKIMESSAFPAIKRKQALLLAAEECLLITGLELTKNKWPSKSYYTDLGRLAYDQVAFAYQPVDTFYIELAENFKLLSSVLNKCKVPL
jgi:hypothetical protein